MKVDTATVVVPNGMNVSNGNGIAKAKPLDRLEQSPSDDQNQSFTGVELQKNVVKNVNEAIEVANKAFGEVNVSFKYYVDKKTNHEIVEIVNSETGEKIRQIPPEEILNMLTRMYDLLGILVDTKM
jgi:flagellar protein FlaG